MTPENRKLSAVGLSLAIRTPLGLVHSAPVKQVRAEDLDGWVGIRPGRCDLLCVLRPGLLVFEDDEGLGYVANAGGVLNLRSGQCHVALRSAVMSRSTDGLAATIAASRGKLSERREAERELLDQLLSEAMRRVTEYDPKTWERLP